MKKQKKQLIALCILLLICIVAWVSLTKWNKSQEQKKQEEEEASKVMVTDISTEDVKAFSYQYNNETLSFVKEDDTWYYEADKSIALDQDAVETLVTTAAQFTADQEIRDYEDLSDDADSMVSGNNLSVFSKSIASYIPEDSGSAVVIPVKEYDSSTLTVPASVVIASAVIGIAVIPLLLLAIGIVIWMRRRKK